MCRNCHCLVMGNFTPFQYKNHHILSLKMRKDSFICSSLFCSSSFGSHFANIMACIEFFSSSSSIFLTIYECFISFSWLKLTKIISLLLFCLKYFWVKFTDFWTRMCNELRLAVLSCMFFVKTKLMASLDLVFGPRSIFLKCYIKPQIHRCIEDLSCPGKKMLKIRHSFWLRFIKFSPNKRLSKQMLHFSRPCLNQKKARSFQSILTTPYLRTN